MSWLTKSKKGKSILSGFGKLWNFGKSSVPASGTIDFLGSFFRWGGDKGTELSVNLGEREQQELKLMKYGIIGLALYMIVYKWKR
ncbi:MAG: hypothetical protein [Circular genetic element sp.]|nr:MAG: hypothetical protein [Circular genetic element sp.]